MESQPLFSILVANYNNGRYLSTCLDSILKQDYPNIEIIVVDDGSTDNSLSIIEPYLQKNHRIKLFKNEKNKGVGFTKKRCIDEASGEILGFVDPEDTITSNAISKMIEIHKKHPQVSLAYSNLYYCDEQLNITREKNIKQVPQGKYDFFNEHGDISAFACFKRKSYLKTIGIDSGLKNAEDQDLYFKLYDVGEVILLNEPLYHYRIHEKGLSTLNNVDKSLFWRWKVIMKRAEERGIDVEQMFLDTFVCRDKVKYWLVLDTFVRKNWLFKVIRQVIK